VFATNAAAAREQKFRQKKGLSWEYPQNCERFSHLGEWRVVGRFSFRSNPIIRGLTTDFCGQIVDHT
jgi:hypothetical protein